MDSSGRPAIHVPVFQYFIFWTAFYMLRGSSQSSAGYAAQPSSRRGYSNSLTPTFPGVHRVSHHGLCPQNHLWQAASCALVHASALAAGQRHGALHSCRRDIGDRFMPTFPGGHRLSCCGPW